MIRFQEKIQEHSNAILDSIRTPNIVEYRHAKSVRVFREDYSNMYYCFN